MEATRKSEPSLGGFAELWTKYLEFKRSACKQSTMANQYRAYSRNLGNCPYSWDEPAKMQRWALAELTQDSARRWFVALNACCKWGVKSKLIQHNPFADLLIEKSKTAESEEIDPFTAEERDTLIAAFEASRHYSYYTPFVKFLFWTGCRPSEAIALEWVHIDKNWISFRQGATLNEEGRVTVSPGLKTQERQRVKLNDRIKELLNGLEKTIDTPRRERTGILGSTIGLAETGFRQPQ